MTEEILPEGQAASLQAATIEEIHVHPKNHQATEDINKETREVWEEVDRRIQSLHPIYHNHLDFHCTLQLSVYSHCSNQNLNMRSTVRISIARQTLAIWFSSKKIGTKQLQTTNTSLFQINRQFDADTKTNGLTQMKKKSFDKVSLKYLKMF